MRIAFVIHSLRAGGAERSVTAMANHWSANGHECSILTLSPARAAFALHPAVKVDSFESRLPKLLAIPAMIAWLRRNVTRIAPDTVLSFTDAVNVIACISGIGRMAPLIVCERVYPEFHTLVSQGGNPRLRRAASGARLLAYRLSALTAVQSNRAKDWFPLSWRDRIAVVPNAIAPIGPIRPVSGPRHPTAVAMGRLVPQKRFDLLLRAFAQGAPGDWMLRIYGQGPLAEDLLALSRSLGTEARVELRGIASPEEAFSGADLFVSSSDFEGWPNALAEAMYAGLPVIATDCLTGPRELIEDEKSGLLVQPGSVSSLANAISRAAADGELRQRLGIGAKERASELSLERIMPLWEEAISVAERNFRRG